ncbi:WD repeat-containing protein 17-like [Ylistrum balloti]|uniref:WD repeat-containing protein 17-like n=1 Tax=Ylistrum balloti TaxID=509963 RepID=UPI0029058FDC|nr:WD repeat-containing protein 17-like [Ylistrum balloti]
MVKQVGLVPAGCQPWNNDVVAASGDRFVYCATMAIYIYQLDKKFQEFKLVSIMSEHKKTITAIAFNPSNKDILASCSADHRVIVWDCDQQKILAQLENTKDIPIGIGWCFHGNEAVTFTSRRGQFFKWHYQNPATKLMTIREVTGFSSDVFIFRWHPRNTSKIVLGHRNGTLSICHIGGKSYKHVCAPDENSDSEEEDPVTALEWDPLSTDYLIIANTFGTIRLIDSNSLNIIIRFIMPSVASQVSSLSWIDSAPGMFVTGDAKTGVLRVWSVSRSSPLETIRLKQTGIHALQAVCSTVTSSELSSELCGISSNPSSSTQAQPPSSIKNPHFALPPAKILCTFLDGGVGLYDIGQSKWIFLRDEGHIETIFDCKFQPDNPDHLATASFDGSIKVWNVNTLTTVYISPGNEGVIYSLSWAPADLHCIVASTSKNGMFIWDIHKSKVIKRFSEHTKGAVYSVAWCQKDSKRIASVGADGYCIIRLISGDVLQRYKHPGPVYGCDWSPTNKDMLATGCEDMCVRVFYIVSSTEQALKTFKGHTSKVFHVKWSPLREGILCSGSDDSTIRIWDYTQDTCIMVLKGHEAPVRGLLWNSEIPYMLISGSWDSKIRVWDVRDGACVETILDHGADVYGLTCHPRRPFLLASSSRDSTLRLWSLNSLIQPIEINIIAGKPWSDIIGTVEAAMDVGNPPLLAGRVSKDIKLELEQPNNKANMADKKLQLFSKFFCQPRGTNNLWELVSVVKGQDETFLSQHYNQGIMHRKHLLKFKMAEAQELEMVKMSKSGSLGSSIKEEKLRKAAQAHIRVGNVQRYCELMVELGEWQKALSVAPGVSIEYWHSLAKRYTAYLLKDDKKEVIPYSMATGDIETLVHYFTSHGQATDALLASQVACDGLQPNPAPISSVTKCNSTTEPSATHLQLLNHSAQHLADWYFNNGFTELAACCHLAVNDCESAVWRLIQGHELELAVSIGTVLGNTPKQTNLAIEYLSRRCEHLCKWDLAVDILKLLPDPDLLLAKCCARCAASMDEINLLHSRAGLPSLEECTHQAETLKLKLDVFQCVKFYLLSTTPELGLEIGLQEVKGQMSKPRWSVDSIFPMLQLLGCIRSDKLQQHKAETLKFELLCLSAYIGALMAIKNGYNSLVGYLLAHARNILQKTDLHLSINDTSINDELTAWRSVEKYRDSRSNFDLKAATLSPEVIAIYQRLIERAGVDEELRSLGPDCMASSNLPTHSDIHVSCISGQRTLGLAYFLEDGKSAVSPNEALMWAKVNPFTPLGSALRINPF